MFCTANLFAYMLRVPQIRSQEEFRATLNKTISHIALPDWHPPAKVVTVEDPSKEAEKSDGFLYCKPVVNQIRLCRSRSAFSFKA